MSEMQRPTPKLSPLPEAISEAEIWLLESGDDDAAVKNSILSIATKLIWLENTGSLWNSPAPTLYSISLTTIYNRLRHGKPAPSPVKNLLKDIGLTRKLIAEGKTIRPPVQRPLEDFEDLYYVCLAVIRELYDRIRVRINEGFTEADDFVTDAKDPATGAYMTAAIAHRELRRWWNVLNSPALVKTLNEAVVRERVKTMHADVLRRVENGQFGRQMGEQIIEEMYAKDEREEIEGLAWIGGWAPGLISAWLEEKYRVMFEVEREEEKGKGKGKVEKSKFPHPCNSDTDSESSTSDQGRTGTFASEVERDECSGQSDAWLCKSYQEQSL
ncbi:hypothetical protein K491DRAFT_690014 [Lophiostoma macrostomum CBS 122681]|uniref:Uncharacterized protein n=1 Tax=Lophiostoma macrostomum CBS 122681 TaxID=1314788 RepID=A0A6A6TEP6_9PLEO|nr:hypothetical protein K491DRAFT_690014 [Lophiostoma macrostomum CBS 122681]